MLLRPLSLEERATHRLTLIKVVRNFLATSTHLLTKYRLLLVTLFFGVLLPLLIFGKLVEDVWEDGGFDWDIPLLQFIHLYATPARDAVVIFITRLGSIRVMLLFTAAIFLILLNLKQQGKALFFLVATGGAIVINVLAKLFFHRPRPTLWMSPVPEDDYSFPSGHAMGTMAAIASLIILTWSTRWRWPILILGGLFVFAVGLSRVYLGVHFPSDILAGWSASLAWVTGVYHILSSQFFQSWLGQRRAPK